MSVKKKEEAGRSEAPVKKREKKGDLVYLGPSIQGTIRRFTVFKDGVLTKKTQECVEEFPVMKRLFVEVCKMPEAVKELNKKQSALEAVYEQTAQKFTRRV